MKIKFFLMTVGWMLALVLTSCSTSYEPKTIDATSKEFTSGELASYVELGSYYGELSFAEKDGAIKTQYLRLEVNLKMVKDGFKNVDARDINFTKLLSVAVINLVDKDGIKIQDLSIKNEDLLKLKKLLIGEEGDSEDFIFEGEFHNSKDAPKWFAETTGFTPYLTGDITIGSNTNGNNHISSKANIKDDNDVDDVDDDDDNDDTSYSNSSASTEDWDAFLDEYESYTNKAIRYMKKAKNGDMSALAEYYAMVEQAEELNKKYEKALKEMSPKQAVRYSEITNKLLEAAQDME